MMRLNPNPRENLREGMRVQSDLNGKPDAVYVVRLLYDRSDASQGFAAVVETENGDNVGSTPTAACWFWPVGVLASVVEDPARIRRLKTDLDAANAALVAVRAMNLRQYNRLRAIRAAVEDGDPK